jgi:hypothetical protein
VRSKLLVLTVASVALSVGQILGPAPAQADPADDPCQLAVTFLCTFMPIAPDLDHDVDMTQHQAQLNPTEPEPDARPPTNICANGCV